MATCNTAYTDSQWSNGKYSWPDDEERMIDDISYGDTIGKSDHLATEWVYNYYVQKIRLS